MKKTKKTMVPDLSEFIDENGKKWIQTSVEDLFSSKELSSIMKSMEEDKENEDIILAKVNFQRVNKEYYDKAVELEGKLEKQNELLKKLLVEAKKTIDKKNEKLKELIDYIKKIHLLLAYHKLKPESIEEFEILPSLLSDKERQEDVIEDIEKISKKEVKNVETGEILLNDEGEETEMVEL